MEDKLLIWKLNHGSTDALCRIYEKYRDDLVRIAAGLLNNMSVGAGGLSDARAFCGQMRNQKEP